jgi:hypothetical protein
MQSVVLGLVVLGHSTLLETPLGLVVVVVADPDRDPDAASAPSTARNSN